MTSYLIILYLDKEIMIISTDGDMELGRTTGKEDFKVELSG
jgi:hypothetical protein